MNSERIYRPTFDPAELPEQVLPGVLLLVLLSLLLVLGGATCLTVLVL